jgi:hypothetical protein
VRRVVPVILALAAAGSLTSAAAADEPVVLAGAAIPRIEPFTADAVPCGATSCLRIAFRARGAIGPRLTWRLTVLRPDGVAAYDGTGRTRRGHRVEGLLEPATPPPCGRYRVLLRISAPGGDHVDAARSVARRRGCVSPRPRKPVEPPE